MVGVTGQRYAYEAAAGYALDQLCGVAGGRYSVEPDDDDWDVAVAFGVFVADDWDDSGSQPAMGAYWAAFRDRPMPSDADMVDVMSRVPPTGEGL